MAPQGFTVRFFTFFYNKFGPAGLIMVPFFTLSCEKICYDTFQAFRGHDIYTNGPAEGARGGFPSGGSGLPSFSLIPVQKWPMSEVSNTDACMTNTLKTETSAIANDTNLRNAVDSIRNK
mmetsp:Transcript_32077/g.54100  ORF Transcript_32077/g.54100 Transcript_32077/m.54100 type:complete len:120 (-) Transcript_32077:1450-1809(-)